MPRITKVQSKIMNDHLQASMANKFDLIDFPTFGIGELTRVDFDETKSLLLEGKTIKKLFEQIEINYCSTGSMVMSRIMRHASSNYGADLRKGFRIYLSKYFSIN